MKKTVKTILKTAFAFAVLFPLFYALMLSFFGPEDFNSPVARLFPASLHFENYLTAMKNPEYLTYTMNSVVTALLAAVIRMAVIVLGAYAFAFLTFPGKNVILYSLILTLFIPGDAILFENYVTVSGLGLLDTWLGIIAPSLFSATQLIMVFTAMRNINRECIEAAEMDGAGDRIIITKIVMPLTKAILITVFLQTLISVFNAYLWPLLVTNRPDMRTIQIGISMMGFGEQGDKGPLFATVILTMLPFLILTLAAKKQIIKALTNGLTY